MLTLSGPGSVLCDGISRRSFLRIGGLSMGGIGLPEILRAEAAAGRTRSDKSVIMIFLSGGPPHQDMVDLKPEAPAEIRGEFQPIATNVPGIEICELLPLLARRMDRLAVIRSLVGSEGRHAAFQCLTGRTVAPQPPGGWPSFGSVVSRIQGAVDVSIPPFVSLTPRMKVPTWGDPGQPGFCRQAHAPLAPGAGTLDLELKVTREELGARKNLLQVLDRLKRDAEHSGVLDAADSCYQQAFSLLTSSRLTDALDLELEDPRVRDRYGRGCLEPAGFGDAGPITNDYFLTARRLIEAGVRVVSLAYGRWDWHGRPHGTNFENARDHLPLLDQGLAALLDDLHERGLAGDVSVIVWGEFGRTPRINRNGGRDHWPQVGCALLAGGGMRTGQVIGSTNQYAEVPNSRPVHFQEVFATLYQNLGIDPNHTTLDDLTGRPQYLVDHDLYRPLAELV